MKKTDYKVLLLLAATTVAGLVLLTATSSRASPGVTERVSVDSNGAQGNLDSNRPSISSDGRHVAFDSQASNLVANDTNNAVDVFVRDLQTGLTQRVSVTTGGLQGNGTSWNAAISADGRYVVFRSQASNLVADDTNGEQDVFVHDRVSSTTQRVNISSSGEQTSGAIGPGLAISADGRYVAFTSGAPNLVDTDTNGWPDTFIHDRQTGTTERVSVASGGTQQDLSSGGDLAISSDGRFVMFESGARNLVPGDTNFSEDVFLRDRLLNTTERVSVASNGDQATGGHSFSGGMSPDARYFAFHSGATNLVSGDTNGFADVFVHDRQTHLTERVSVTSSGGQTNGGVAPAVSANGRFVVFHSFASNIVPGDDNGVSDVFLRDRASGTTERASIASDGSQASGGHSQYADLNSDGRFVAFESAATNLVASDTNNRSDIFRHDRGPVAPPPSETPTPAPTPLTFTVNTTGDLPDVTAADGICQTATPGQCSLRAAIQQSNATAGIQAVAFNIGGGGMQTISPTSALPDVTDTVVIDGATQPGYTGLRLIQLNGGTAGGGSDGLRFTVGGSVVQALIITQFGGDGLDLSGGTTKIYNNSISSNSGHGVHITSSANNIGDPVMGGTRNGISSNTGAGVFVASGIDNFISSTLGDNGGLGIDLAPAGPTANDPGDGDTGPNNLQNSPVVTRAYRVAPFSADSRVEGTLNSKPNTTFRIDVFTTYPPHFGCSLDSEGGNWMGSTTATTDAAGNTTWTKALFIDDTTPRGFTAVAIDPSGNTSEISNCVQLQEATPTPTVSATPTRTPTPPPTATATPTATPLLDGDSDGWSSSTENTIGTDPLDACPDNAADDAWPADINNDTFVDISDVAFVAGVFGQSVPPAPARYNIAPDPPDGFVDITDVSRMTGLFGQSCG